MHSIILLRFLLHSVHPHIWSWTTRAKSNSVLLLQLQFATQAPQSTPLRSFPDWRRATFYPFLQQPPLSSPGCVSHLWLTDTSICFLFHWPQKNDGGTDGRTNRFLFIPNTATRFCECPGGHLFIPFRVQGESFYSPEFHTFVRLFVRKTQTGIQSTDGRIEKPAVHQRTTSKTNEV